MSRKKWGRVAWEKACELVVVDDGLPVVSTAGIWTADKLYFLCTYLVQVLEGMHGNSAFPDGIVFVDCFAGTGVCVVTDSDGRQRRYPGSALIAASLQPHGKALSKIIAIEKDLAHLDALRTRLQTVGFQGELVCLNVDFNGHAAAVAAAIPRRSLNVAFVDPYALDCHYTAIATLAQSRALDLVILFSDRIDLQRNVETVYYPRHNLKLDDFLGHDSDWRQRFDTLPDRSGLKLRDLFAKLYLDQLRKLGYDHCDSWALDGPMGPMFRLVFASKHALGLKYCDIARRDRLDGTTTLFG